MVMTGLNEVYCGRKCFLWPLRNSKNQSNYLQTVYTRNEFLESIKCKITVYKEVLISIIILLLKALK